jgi:hypothetical protein
MIYADSRYASGTVVRAEDARNNTYQVAVYRNWPTIQSGFYAYTWVEGDRIDVVSNNLLGSPSFWWRIMDLNPELTDPFDIKPGTTIRIPSA